MKIILSKQIASLVQFTSKTYLNKEHQAGLVTSFIEKPNLNFNSMYDFLKERGFIIYPGKIGNKKTFRVANIGNINYRDIKRFLKTLEGYLCQKK